MSTKSKRKVVEETTEKVPQDTPGTIINSGSTTFNSFNDRFQTACGTPGAPKAPTSVSVDSPGKVTIHTAFLSELVISFIASVAAKGGLVVGDVGILTNHAILAALQTVNCALTMDKCVITPYRMKLYNWLNCSVRRSTLPGDIIPHLKRRPFLRGQPIDVDLLEPLRVVGSTKKSHFRQENERRAIHHRKFLVALLPDKKGRLIPTSVLMGSANLSENMDSSHEVIDHYADCPEMARAFYDIWAHSYSLSESLGIHDAETSPAYEWSAKPIAKYTPHDCPACGTEHTTVKWADDPDDDNPNPTYRRKIRVLWCSNCQGIVKTL